MGQGVSPYSQTRDWHLEAPQFYEWRNKMSTLKELIEKHGMPLKVKKHEWLEGGYFEARYILDNRVYGHNEYKDSCEWSTTNAPGWKIYQEPKKKVKIYLWAVKSNDDVWQLSNYYEDEADVNDNHTGVKIVKRLDYTMIEVEK